MIILFTNFFTNPFFVAWYLTGRNEQSSLGHYFGHEFGEKPCKGTGEHEIN